MNQDVPVNAFKERFDARVNRAKERLDELRTKAWGGKEEVSRNTNTEFDDNQTFGQRVADKVAAFGGSWTFIGLFGGTMLLWIVLNSILLVRRGDTFDPYPYILL